MRKLLESLGGLLVVAMIFFGAPETWAQEVGFTATGTMQLSWVAPTENVDGSPLTDLAAFKVYVGSASRVYDQEIDIPDPGQTATTVDIEVTQPVTQFYVAMTALDADGNESGYSNEVIKTVTVSFDADPMPPILQDIPIDITGCVVIDNPGVRCTVTVD